MVTEEGFGGAARLAVGRRIVSARHGAEPPEEQHVQGEAREEGARGLHAEGEDLLGLPLPFVGEGVGVVFQKLFVPATRI